MTYKSRKTITITTNSFEHLKKAKGDRSWDRYLLLLKAKAKRYEEIKKEKENQNNPTDS